jgi:hypothetical protein
MVNPPDEEGTTDAHRGTAADGEGADEAAAAAFGR